MASKKVKHGNLIDIDPLRVSIFIIFLFIIFVIKIIPSSATARTTSCGTVGTLANGSFVGVNVIDIPCTYGGSMGSRRNN